MPGVVETWAGAMTNYSPDSLKNKEEHMDRRHAVISTLLLGASMLVYFTASNAQEAAANVHVSVLASGLNNPRGLKFGPDGKLYVAEGGIGGSQLPPNRPRCTVVPPVGPYTGSAVGSRISRIDADGNRTTVADNLPSSQTSADLGSLVSGVADIAFVGNTMYAILAGAGCSHGVTSVPNAVIRVHHNGTWNMVANLSAYQRAHPVANPQPADFEPDGTWYSMIALDGDLYAVEPNHGEIVRVTTDGNITRVIDVSASQGHVVPTALAYKGTFYVANLGVFPQDAGTSKVWTVSPVGQIKLAATGFNMVLGLAFDQRGRMYVLEMSAAPAPTPGTGRVVRLSHDGTRRTVIVDGLFLPTGMTFGPDGNLYVSNIGFGAPPTGMGEVRKIELD
jgi:SMP-30/Gluconolactonase/LRE-like region